MDLLELRDTARRLMRANDVNPDPNTSLVICSVALLGLAARRRSGLGQQIFVDMFGTNAWANFDDCFSHPGKGPRRSPDREGFGLHPLWRLYPCASGWVFLGIARDAEWDAMRSLLGAAMREVPAVSLQAARDGGEPMVAALRAMFAGAPAAQWEARLAPHGVGCVQADAGLPEQFFLKDPQALQEAITLPAQHPEWGAYRRHGAQVVLHGTPGIYQGTCLNGQHTDALLAELGLDAQAIAALRAAVVVR